MLDWFFRSRVTGRITIAQTPNTALVVFILGAVVAAVAGPGQVGGIAEIVATVGLVLWAADELIRGVNPFRRLLGFGVLAWKAASLAN